jgi:hypothetical protein
MTTATMTATTTTRTAPPDVAHSIECFRRNTRAAERALALAKSAGNPDAIARAEVRIA